jgi:hypothetical protein
MLSQNVEQIEQELKKITEEERQLDLEIHKYMTQGSIIETYLEQVDSSRFYYSF